MNCSWAIGILLASKGKSHKLVEMVCVWWLPWMFCNKHTKSCVLFFVVKFVVQVFWIPMATFFVCPSLLHRLHITYVLLPSLAFSYLVDGSNNFQYSLMSPILSSQVTLVSLSSKKVFFFIPTMVIQRYGCKYVRKRVVNKLLFA